MCKTSLAEAEVRRGTSFEKVGELVALLEKLDNADVKLKRQWKEANDLYQKAAEDQHEHANVQMAFWKFRCEEEKAEDEETQGKLKSATDILIPSLGRDSHVVKFLKDYLLKMEKEMYEKKITCAETRSGHNDAALSSSTIAAH